MLGPLKQRILNIAHVYPPKSKRVGWKDIFIASKARGILRFQTEF
jgi:hypothetical protein